MDGKTIVDRWRLDHWPHLAHEDIVGTDALVRAIDAALAQARADEREECANIAQRLGVPLRLRDEAEVVADMVQTAIAKAIRARSTP